MKIPVSSISGKHVAIALVVAVSASSFALGYFVGRSTSGAGQGDEALSYEPRQDEDNPSQADVPPANDMTEVDSVREMISGQGPGAGAAETEHNASAGVMNSSSSYSSLPPAGPAASAPVEKKSPNTVKSTVRQAKPSVSEKTASSKVSPADFGTGKGADRNYCVQAGAFTRTEDAEALKKKLLAGGYEAYVYKSPVASDKAPNKVRIGKAEGREAAQELAARIRRTHGLSGFIVKAR